MRQAIATIFLLVALVASGCATHSPKQPIQFGMYFVPERNLAEVRQLGVDFVIGSADPRFLNSAQSAGLKVVVPAEARVSHRAVSARILKDEPDLHGVSPEAVAADYRQARRIGQEPVILNLSSAGAAESYVTNCDVLMFDWYPIGWMPIETFFNQLKVARLAAAKKPFYAVVQAFDWAHYPHAMPASATHRKPTPTELRAMTLWAAMNGASGIVFYPFDDGYDSLSRSPELVSAIHDSIALIKNYDWLFESKPAWIDYPFRFQNPADQTNAIAQTSIEIRAWKIDAKTTVIVAANTTTRPIVARSLIAFDECGGSRELRFEPLEVKFLTARDISK